MKQLAADRKDVLISVVLQCSLEENCRRVQQASRRHRKLTDPEPLTRWRSQYQLISGDAEHELQLDNTSLTANEAAKEIHAFVQRVMARQSAERS